MQRIGSPPFSTDVGSRFYAAALEVYKAGLGLTDEQKTIALYWADGSWRHRHAAGALDRHCQPDLAQ